MVILKYLLVFVLILIVLAFIISSQQEKMLFFPEKLPKNFRFAFDYPYSEVLIRVDEKITLHGLHFKVNSPKGVVLYLHGNAGSNAMWGSIAGNYLTNGYDFFIPDYRGYGKSDGKIISENQFLNDISIIYDTINKKFAEKNIVIIGYSIGTGPATWLAANRNPGLLILKAPYYNIPDVAKKHIPFFPGFLIRYKFRTDLHLPRVKCPVVIFHGDKDEVIYTSSSYKLQKLFKPEDRIIILKNQAHNGMNDNFVYLQELKKMLH